MKNAVLFLAALNVIFFISQIFMPDDDDSVPVTKSSSKNSRYKTITLLHESTQSDFSSSQSTPKPSSKSKSTSNSKSKPVTKSKATISKGNKGSKKTAKSKQQSSTKPSSKKKKTISSRIGEAREKREKLAKNEIVSCFKLGPYSVKLNAEKSLSRTKSYGAIASIYIQEKRERFRYWVLVPTRNKQAALKIIKRFKAKGVEDVYLIRDGKKKDDISLGIFRARSTAQKRIQTLKNLGFNPVVEKHYKVRNEYWLAVKETIRGPLSGSAWKDIKGDIEGLKKSKESC